MRHSGLDQHGWFACDVCLSTVLLVNPGKLTGVCSMWRVVWFGSVSVSLGVDLFGVEGIEACTVFDYLRGSSKTLRLRSIVHVC